MKFVYTDWHRQLGDRLREARLDAGYSLQQVGTAEAGIRRDPLRSVFIAAAIGFVSAIVAKRL